MNQNAHEPDDIIRMPEVKQKTGLSESTIYEMIADGKFPKNIKLGPRASGWIYKEVAAWVQQRIAERDRATCSQ